MMSIENLIEAYNATSYQTTEDPLLNVRIGESNKKLNSYLNKKNYNSWVFITASNPMSIVQLSDAINTQRNIKLKNQIINNAWPFLHGQGVPDKGNWRSEESFMIFNISKNEAIKLAKKFDQRAFVFGEINKTAELVMT
jgi:hypothetical protein